MRHFLICITLPLLAHPAFGQSSLPAPQDSIMRSLRTSSDTVALTTEFLGAARFARDSAIHAVAAEIADDPTASPEARAASLGVLYIYEEPGYYMPYGELVSGTCASHGRWVDSNPLTGAPLPADYLTQDRQIATLLANDQAAPMSVQNAAKCVLLAAEHRDMAAPVDASLIHMVYLCGNKLSIRNGNRRIVMFDYRVMGTMERWNDQAVMARPDGQEYGERVIQTQTVGTVELLVDGQVIQTTANGGTACSS